MLQVIHLPRELPAVNEICVNDKVYREDKSYGGIGQLFLQEDNMGKCALILYCSLSHDHVQFQ